MEDKKINIETVKFYLCETCKRQYVTKANALACKDFNNGSNDWVCRPDNNK